MKRLERTDLDGLVCSAMFSDDEAYRYELSWRWSEQPALVAWMLNPSTATHEVLDPTVAGLVTRARAWGHGAVQVINLFALRATYPEDMLAHPEPVGPENDMVTRAVLDQIARDNAVLICGWGSTGGHINRDRRGIELAAVAGVPMHALQINKDGRPRHPLYIAHARRPFVWTPA